MRERVLMIGLVVLAACGPGGGGEADAPAEAAGAGVLASSLEVQVGPDSVGLMLAVANTGATPVVLEYPTAQEYEFVVADSAGGEVWRWSADRMFAQVVRVDTVAAGATRTYRAVWRHGGRRGDYTATGALASTNQSLELTTRFAVSTR